MQPHDRHLGTGPFPHGRDAARKPLGFIDHDMGQTVFAFECEHLGPMSVLKPGLVPELHGDWGSGKLLRRIPGYAQDLSFRTQTRAETSSPAHTFRSLMNPDQRVEARWAQCNQCWLT